MALAKQMKAWRKEKALSRRGAAARAGIAFSTWARIERGEGFLPDTESAVRAAIDPDNWRPAPGSLADRVRDLERRVAAIEARR